MWFFQGKAVKKSMVFISLKQLEIIIHNHNFKDDNALLYTAIHEYAHHVHFSKSGPAPAQ
jgi:hypothetical protein